MNHSFCVRMLSRFLAAALALAGGALPALAAVPTTERQVLIDLYNGTNGSGWVNHTNWLSGDPCDNAWWGISCDPAKTHVTSIQLQHNRLTGPMPVSLDQLPELEYIDVQGNQLTGNIPSLSTLTSLRFFGVSSNLLTGSIPSLSGLTKLESFSVSGNQLSGAIPSLSGLTNLRDFLAYSNQLTGPIPSLSGLTNLAYFGLADNRLTGSIPSLSGLTSLEYFYVDHNSLTGAIPSLSGLTNLVYFLVSDNQLSGAVPAAPASLGSAGLCPNYLNPSSPTDADWNAATGQTPWSARCAASPSYTVTVNAGSGTASPAGVSGAAGTTPVFALTPPAGQAVSQVSSTCGLVIGEPAVVTPGPLSSFTTLPLIGDCALSVDYAPAAATAVPTLGEWARVWLSLGLLLGGLGVVRARRGSRTLSCK